MKTIAEEVTSWWTDTEHGDIGQLISILSVREAKVLAENERLREACEFAKGAIMDAIGLEDGLDGAAGTAVIKMIDDALAAPQDSLREFLATDSGDVMLKSLKTIGVEFICDQAGPGWRNLRAAPQDEGERLSLKEILEVLYRGRTMVNFNHVPSVTRAIDWLSMDFRAAIEKKVASQRPADTAKEPR